MPRKHNAPVDPQLSLDFSALAGAPVAPPPAKPLAEMAAEPTPKAGAVVVRLDERRRRGHLDAVRSLLAQTGVFPVRGA